MHQIEPAQIFQHHSNSRTSSLVLNRPVPAKYRSPLMKPEASSKIWMNLKFCFRVSRPTDKCWLRESLWCSSELPFWIFTKLKDCRESPETGHGCETLTVISLTETCPFSQTCYQLCLCAENPSLPVYLSTQNGESDSYNNGVFHVWPFTSVKIFLSAPWIGFNSPYHSC